MSKVNYEEEMLRIINDLEAIPENALSLIKKVYKETCAEIGVDRISFFPILL